MNRRLKKSVAVLCLLVAAAVCMIFPQTALADANATTISSSATTVTAGETFTTTVQFQAGVALYTAQMDIGYSTDLLELVNVERVDASAAGSGNPFKMTFESDNGAKAATMAKITFKVKTTAPEGQKATVSVSNAYGSDANFGKVVLASSTATITVASPKSTDASLSALTVEGQDLMPSFSAETEKYEMSVENSVKSLKISATAHDVKASVAITGANNLKEGENTVKVVVTAEAGNQKTYTITVLRAAAPVSSAPPPVSSEPPVSSSTLSNNTQLTKLTLKDIALAFSPTVREYAVTVPNKQSAAEITATAKEADATVTVLLNSKKLADGKGEFKVGKNYVIVQVTAPDGVTVRSYNIVVTREAEAISSQAPASSAPVSSTPVSSAPVSSAVNSQETSSETVSSTDSSQTASSEGVSSQVSSATNTSSENVSAQPSVSEEPPTSSQTKTEGENAFLNWLRQDRSALAIHAAYIGGMVLCLLIGCMLGYYVRGRKKD